MLSNCNCHPTKKVNRSSSASLFSTVVLIILPKCPICIMAYSSAITICGGTDMYFRSNNWVSYVPLVLALFINLMFLFNWRGQRTLYALTIAMVGFTLISLTHQLVLSPIFYDLGAVLLLMSIWLNSSLISLLNKFRRKLRPGISNW
jgi:hypothetical protein